MICTVLNFIICLDYKQNFVNKMAYDVFLKHYTIKEYISTICNSFQLGPDFYF